MALIDNLVSYWKLDESSDGSSPVTRADSAGSNTLSDGNTTPSAAAKISNGANFRAASSEYLYKTAFSGLNFGTGDFSISSWVYFTANPDGKVVMHWGVESPFRSASFSIGGGGTLNLYINDGASTSVSSTGTVGTSGWHHVVVTRTSGTVAFYIDGADASGGGSNTRSVPASGGLFFAMQFGLYVAIDLLQDEVGVWSRALSGAEVTTLYNSGAGLTYPFTVASANGNFLGLM